MKKDNWKQYALWIAVSEAAGILSGLLSMEGMKAYSQTTIQPGFAPPDILFPIVWTILYALMAVSYTHLTLTTICSG